MSEAEDTVWQGGPTQWTGINAYFISWLIILILIAVSVMIGMWVTPMGFWGLALVLIVFLYQLYVFIDIKSEKYKLTSQRLIVTEGILSKKTEEIELYRVKDWSLEKPFFLRLIGRGHVILETSDTSAPKIVLRGIVGPDSVRELVRTNVEKYRDKKRVRHLDMDMHENDTL